MRSGPDMRGGPLVTRGRRPRGGATLIAALLALIWQATWTGGADATSPSALQTVDLQVAMPLAPASRAEAHRAADPAQRASWIEPDDPPPLPQDAPAPVAEARATTASTGAAAFLPADGMAYASRAPPGPA
jgi:hypothetical protein